jgi:hypothetical protein
MPLTECEFCHVEHTVAVPCIHLNGSPAENLRDDLAAAVEAVHDAQNRVMAAAPNGRDYYVYPGRDQGHLNDPIQTVMHQHRLRLEKLVQVANELEQMRDHVQAVIDFREQQRAERRRSR